MRLEIVLRADMLGNVEAQCRDLPDCAVRGRTRDEAIIGIYNQVKETLEQRRSAGLPLPAGNRVGACEIIQLEIG